MNGPRTHTDEELRALLERSHTIAVLGASPRPERAAHYVPRYLQEQGYELLPVNPQYAPQEVFGHPSASNLADLDRAVDIVDVFRRSQDLPGHVEDILAMKPPPAVVWFQLGIRNDEVANALSAAGIDVVQDRCIMVDHRNLLGSNVVGLGDDPEG